MEREENREGTAGLASPPPSSLLARLPMGISDGGQGRREVVEARGAGQVEPPPSSSDIGAERNRRRNCIIPLVNTPYEHALNI